MAKRYSVWCVTAGRWCGISPRHVLQLNDRPYVNMTSTDELCAKIRARSLAREFPDLKFKAKEV